MYGVGFKRIILLHEKLPLLIYCHNDTHHEYYKTESINYLNASKSTVIVIHIPLYQNPLSLIIYEIKMSTIFPAMNATLFIK